MKKLISILFATTLCLASCSKDSEVYYYDMYLAIEVVDSQGNDLLGSSSPLVHQGESKAIIGSSECYLDSQDHSVYTFRRILNDTNSYLKIGSWSTDRKDFKITIDWSGDIAKDVIMFSYDSHIDGLESQSHDFRYPYSITINGENLDFNADRGHFIYVKDMN